MTAPVNKFPAENGVSTEYAREDHKHGVDTAAPVPITSSNIAEEGTSTALSRSDHKHPHGNHCNGALHAPVTRLTNGFMSKEDKINLDDLVGGEPRRINNLSKFQLINAFKILFSVNADGVILPELVPNIIKFDQFIDYSKIDDRKKVDLTGNGISLSVEGDTVLFDDCTDLDGLYSGWVSNCSSVRVEEEDHTLDGFELYLSCNKNNRTYSAVQTWDKPANWDMFSAIVVDASTESPTAMISMSVRDGNEWQQAVLRPFSSNGIAKNVILNLPDTRSNITGISIGIYEAEYLGEALSRVGNIRLVRGSSSIAQKGSFTTVNTEYSTDILDIIVCGNETLPLELGKICIDVSLDGGVHWVTNVKKNTVLDAKNGALTFSDGGVPWSNKRTLKLRYNFYSEESISPVLNNYLVIVSRE